VRRAGCAAAGDVPLDPRVRPNAPYDEAAAERIANDDQPAIDRFFAAQHAKSVPLSLTPEELVPVLLDERLALDGWGDKVADLAFRRLKNVPPAPHLVDLLRENLRIAKRAGIQHAWYSASLLGRWGSQGRAAIPEICDLLRHAGDDLAAARLRGVPASVDPADWTSPKGLASMAFGYRSLAATLADVGADEPSAAECVLSVAETVSEPEIFEGAAGALSRFSPLADLDGERLLRLLARAPASDTLVRTDILAAAALAARSVEGLPADSEERGEALGRLIHEQGRNWGSRRSGSCDDAGSTGLRVLRRTDVGTILILPTVEHESDRSCMNPSAVRDLAAHLAGLGFPVEPYWEIAPAVDPPLCGND
jgi:hypothetical protein